MKSKLILTVFVITLGFALAKDGDAQSVRPKFKTITVPGSQSTVIASINDSNVQVGEYVDSSGVQHGMTIKGGTVTNIDDPMGTHTFCNYENVSEVIVGDYVNSSSVIVGFIYQNGTFSDVLPFGSSSSAIGMINDSGVLVGYYLDPSSNIYKGFYGSGNSFASFSVPGAVDTFADGINNAGTILAPWLDSSGKYQTSMYFPKRGKFRTVDVPGATFTFGDSINNKNEIAYAWTDGSGSYHGAVRLASGKFLKFDDPAGSQTEGNGINDSEIVVGDFVPTGGTVTQGFAVKY